MTTPDPAAAVPEAEDGREAIYQTAYAAWRAATNATRTTFAEADALRKVVDAVLAAVPARDDERERLAAELALRELVRLKDLKDRIDAPDGNEWSPAYYAARADYRENKPKAWAAARAALAAAPLPEGQEG